MKVSIIIPVYNRERCIGGCLESVLNQTYQEIEVIVIDDGSDDGTLDAVRKIADRRLKVISVENGGVSRARNIGIEAATGGYVLFVDSDDYIERDYVANIVRCVEGTDIDILIFGITINHVDGRREVIRMPAFADEHDFYVNYMGTQNGNMGVCGYVCNKLIKRDFIMKHHIRFNPAIKLAEDVDFYLEAFDHDPRIAFSNECGYNYVQSAVAKYTDVDYFALVRIWLKAMRVLAAKQAAESNKDAIVEKIQGLIVAHFLECSSFSIGSIQRDLQEFRSLTADIPEVYLKTSVFYGDFKWVRLESAWMVYLYLCVRRMYHVVWHGWLRQ